MSVLDGGDTSIGKYETVEVNLDLCFKFIEEVLVEYFPKTYLDQYMSICKENPAPLLGYVLVEADTGILVGGILARCQEARGIVGDRRNVIYIEMLATKPQFTNQGLASQLLKEVDKIGYEQGIRRVELHVSMSNGIALQFYYKNGFKMEMAEKNFYQNIKDFQGSKTALLLVKHLNLSKAH